MISESYILTCAVDEDFSLQVKVLQKYSVVIVFIQPNMSCTSSFCNPASTVESWSRPI